MSRILMLCAAAVGVAATVAHADSKPDAHRTLPLRCPAPRLHVNAGRTVAVPAGDAVAALDGDLAAFIASTFPDGRTDPTNSTTFAHRVEDWVVAKQAAAKHLIDGYTAAAHGPPARALESLARMGQVYDIFANDLLSAPIPADVRTGELAAETVDAYCGALADVAKPLIQRARSSYDHCTTHATEQHLTGEWSTWCDDRGITLSR